MSGYQVDLDYLEQTFKQLKSVADQFDAPIACTQYNAALAQSDIGHNFDEATYLYTAHNQMKSELADMLKYLQAMRVRFLLSDLGGDVVSRGGCRSLR